MNSALPTPYSALKKLLKPGELRLEESVREKYAGDKWFATRLPDAVALPRNARTVATILRFANEHRIPVTPRGAGHGYVGGCVPAHGGIALSLERMNKIKEIHSGDFVAVVEPNVITKTLQEAVEKKGLFYPPDPASRADCTLGGNIATNAGGPRCLKYGVTRDYVLGLEVALANGILVRLGSRTHKNKTGFDLHRLFIGSEGMLGVITEATLKLLPFPPERAALAVGFASMKAATDAIRRIFAAGFLPCALELADSFTLAAAAKRTGSKRLGGCKAHIIVELDGQRASVRGEIRALERVIRNSALRTSDSALRIPHSALRPLFVERALGAAECEKIWQIRREFSYALRDTGLTKLNEDVVVPRGSLEALFDFTAALQKKYDVHVACFGHAGDGNIHVNVMVDRSDPKADARGKKALDALFARIIAFGGVITGEHGIGIAKQRWWTLAVSPEARMLHETVKHALDPNNILNPGKFVEP